MEGQCLTWAALQGVLPIEILSQRVGGRVWPKQGCDYLALLQV